MLEELPMLGLSYSQHSHTHRHTHGLGLSGFCDSWINKQITESALSLLSFLHSFLPPFFLSTLLSLLLPSFAFSPKCVCFFFWRKTPLAFGRKILSEEWTHTRTHTHINCFLHSECTFQWKWKNPAHFLSSPLSEKQNKPATWLRCVNVCLHLCPYGIQCKFWDRPPKGFRLEWGLGAWECAAVTDGPHRDSHTNMCAEGMKISAKRKLFLSVCGHILGNYQNLFQQK